MANRSPETVLVTGGTGYVASWAIVALLRAGYRVRATVRSPAKADAVRGAVAALADPGDRLSFHSADLLADDGWADAVAGVDYVLHVASALGGTGADPGTLLRTARDGALRVLRFAHEAGVRRVVLTSAAAASTPADVGRAAITDETLWTDPGGRQLSPYQRAKVLAERAAWDWLAAGDGRTELTTILPGAVFGPIVDGSARGTTAIVERMLTGQLRGLADIKLEIVDVRDLVDLHILAMTAPQAAGQRYLAVSGDLLSMPDIAGILRESLGAAAGRVPTRRLPSLVVRAAARVRPEQRTLASTLGRRHQHTSAKARSELGWAPRPAQDTIVDCARSLIDHGIVTPDA